MRRYHHKIMFKIKIKENTKKDKNNQIKVRNKNNLQRHKQIKEEEEDMLLKRQNNARSVGGDGMVIIGKTINVEPQQRKTKKVNRRRIKFSVIFRSNLFLILFFFCSFVSPYLFFQNTFVNAATREAADG